jgi:hypothetical protein
MREHFWTGWGRHLFSWFAFVFTVGAAIIGLALTTENWWLWASLLIAVAAVASSAFFAYQTHQKAEDLRAEVAREHALRETAERKLNEVPSEMLAVLQRTVAAYAVHELARVLRDRLAYIRRMLDFTEATTKQLSLRKFVRQGGSLYVIAKAEAGAASHVRPADPFVLVRQSPDGLETPCAMLRVHQPPDVEKGVLYFEIVESLSDEIAHVERLAESVDVPKLKGYSVRIACDLEGYEGVDLRNSEAAITRLVQTWLAESEGRT